MVNFAVDDGTHNDETGRSDYEEYIFDIPKKNLADYTIKIESDYYSTYYEGNWVIKLDEPKLLPILDFENTTAFVKGKAIELKDIKLSMLNVSFKYQMKGKKNSTEELALEIKVRMKNGEVLDYRQAEQSSSSSDREIDQSVSYSRLLDLEEVDTLIVNGQDLIRKE